MVDVTPSDVLKLKVPTEGYLCPLSANKYSIEFLAFFIKDYDTRKILFEVSKESVMASMKKALEAGKLKTSSDPDSYRSIVYDFSADVLRTEVITTNLTFKVGNKPLEKFRMIERHYFKSRLIKSFDFEFGFVIPGSTNNWEASYSVPGIDADLLHEIVANPYETTSDSFYFVDNKLVIHNKASYRYYYPDAEGESKGEEEAKADEAASKSEGKEDVEDDAEERVSKKLADEDD